MGDRDLGQKPFSSAVVAFEAETRPKAASANAALAVAIGSVPAGSGDGLRETPGVHDRCEWRTRRPEPADGHTIEVMAEPQPGTMIVKLFAVRFGMLPTCGSPLVTRQWWCADRKMCEVF